MKKRNLFTLLLVLILCFSAILIGCTPSNNGGETDDTHTYYTVTFDSNGGSAVESQRVMQGNPVRRPDLPTYQGYDFLGWYTDKDANETLWKFDTDRVNANITLYAGWKKTAQEGEELKPTESLVFEREGDTYIVKDVGEETAIVIPAMHEGLPVVAIRGDYGNGAFARKDIVSVVIPDSILEIGQNTFNNCRNLETVTISNNSQLQTIGNNAFSGCHALKEIFLPKGLAELGSSVFNNCGGLEKFTVDSQNPNFRSENGHLIESKTNTLIRGGHNNQIPNSVQIIASAAFRKTTGITDLYIPSSVTKIENYFIADSTITTVLYQGSLDEWNAVEKTDMWNYGNRDVNLEFQSNPTPNESKVLVAYFSATGNTQKIADQIAKYLTASTYQIEPKVPYTADDLKYYTDCRADKEQADPNSRPEINGSIENIASFDIIFLGYPIWHGQAPKIIYTFLESYNFSGKTIVPFCTSASSGVGSSATNLHSLVNNVDWKDGKRFSSSSQTQEITNWIDSLNLNTNKDEQVKTVKVYVQNRSIEIELADNPSAKAFAEKLKNSDIIVEMDDYGDFEKVGGLGFNLPRTDTQITTTPGDVILYLGSRITIYYDTNSWNFTLLGKIPNMTRDKMLEFFGGMGSVSVRFSLK